MTAKGVLIVGSGKRVRQAALPALHRLAGRFEVRGVFARTAKRIEVEGERYEVAPLDELRKQDLGGAELLYLAVAKDAVPEVLARLCAFEIGAIDLLIDTPVVRFKHFRHVDRLRRFRHVWVAEDCTCLPWFDAVRAAIGAGDAGPLRRVVFHRSAYAYHGIATAKALLGCERVLRGRRRRRGGPSAVRELVLPRGLRATVVEPRDYALGHVELVCERATFSDESDAAQDVRRLTPIVADGLVRGFRIGAIQTELDRDEADLTRGDPDSAGVTARMDAMKRVGFLRLLRDIDAGRGAYPLGQALEDMAVDYHLEKLGFYFASPLTDPRAGIGRVLVKVLTRLTAPRGRKPA